MYFGESQTHLDEKGRITVPKMYRDVMRVLCHDVWYMTQGFDQSAFLFHRETWNTIRAQVGEYSPMDGRALDFRRLFFGTVAEVRPDRQGRIPVPAHLRAHVGLDTDENNAAVIVGVDDHLELWNPGFWRAFKEQRAADFRAMATELFLGNKDPLTAPGGEMEESG